MHIGRTANFNMPGSCPEDYETTKSDAGHFGGPGSTSRNCTLTILVSCRLSLLHIDMLAEFAAGWSKDATGQQPAHHSLLLQ